MGNQQRQQLKKYFALLLIHWKLLLGCLLAGLTAGVGLYLSMPKVYQCTSLLSYERQRITPARMGPE